MREFRRQRCHRQFNIASMNLLITTYGMATRLAWLAQRPWNVVILDEAQAIKNSISHFPN
ncbi:MAG: hypothetical protein ACP5QA_12550 [Phycisphaerae bacterium]